MGYFKDNEKEPDELYWTKKYEEQQKLNAEKSDNRKPNSYNKAFLILLVTIILMVIAYIINHRSLLSFLDKSQDAEAILINYKYSSILVNQMDGSRLKNYHYSYYFYFDGNKIYSSDLLDEYRFNRCIDKEYKKGDTIIIRFLKNSPTQSKIKCD